MSFYDYKATYRTSKEVGMDIFEGKVVLVVNTASKCGFTPQFKGLERLNKLYQDDGLCVIGFPCNQFANQDPLSDQRILGFCQKNYGVTFPVFAKIDVNGKDEHPLYKYLKGKARGVFWSKRIKWNFTKFLIDHEGNVVQRYAPTTKPRNLIKDIESLLEKANA
jgi:glutathione peroxidase